MTKGSLIGTALAAALIAAPGVALAQNNPSTMGNGSAWNSQVSNSYTNQNTGQNQGQNQAQSNNDRGGWAYNNIGRGGHAGMGTPIITNENDNSGWYGDNNNRFYGAYGAYDNGDNNATRPSQRNALLADNGDIRISVLLDTEVFNRRNQSLGTIADVLVGNNGMWAIIATNQKKVAVPFKRLVLGNANINPHAALVLPNVTEAQLNTLPVFHYNVTNYPGNNDGGRWFGNNYNSGNNGRSSSGSTANNNGWFGNSQGNNNNGNNG